MLNERPATASGKERAMRIGMMVLVAGLAMASGCVPSELTTPADYVRLSSAPYPYCYKAVSAEGVSLAMRQEENPEGGTVEFWAAALRNQLVGRTAIRSRANRRRPVPTGRPGNEWTSRPIFATWPTWRWFGSRANRSSSSKPAVRKRKYGGPGEDRGGLEDGTS